MPAYIYKIKNLINDKIYIGFTTNLKLRIKDHFSKRKPCYRKILHTAIQKYGKSNFDIEVLYESKNITYTHEVIESLYIYSYNSHYLDGHGYNMTYGGKGQSGYRHTDIAKEKNRKITKNRILTTEDKLKMYGHRDLSKTIEVCSKVYKILYVNGEEHTIKNLNKFCKETIYARNRIYDLMYGKLKVYKDIAKVELIL